jgi:hypothetical protein
MNLSPNFSLENLIKETNLDHIRLEVYAPKRCEERSEIAGESLL